MTAAPTAAGWPRILSVGCWIVIGLVVVRMASGGGSFLGFDYVIAEAPLVALIVGGSLVLAATVLVFAFARGDAWAWRASGGIAVAAIVFGVVVGLRGHESAWLLTGSAVVALSVGLRYGV